MTKKKGTRWPREQEENNDNPLNALKPPNSPLAHSTKEVGNKKTKTKGNKKKGTIFFGRQEEKNKKQRNKMTTRMGNFSETPTPTTCLKSTAVHLPFVRQYAPHLYRRTFLASKLRRKGKPAIRLPFVLQCASHLYGSTPPICTAVLLEK